MRISDWSSDVCSSDLIKPERPEIGVETATNAGAEPPIGKFRRGAFVNLPRIDKAHNAEIAKPIAHFSRCLIQAARSEEHTSELQSLMRISYAVFCLKKKKTNFEKKKQSTHTRLLYHPNNRQCSEE